MTAKYSHAPDKLVRDVMRYDEAKKTKDLKLGDPRRHGLKLEPQARQAYMRSQNVSVE